MRRASIAALLAAGTAGIHAASAQELSDSTTLPSASTLTATVSQSLAADSNFDLDDESPGTSYYTDTRLALGLERLTRTQQLLFGIDTGVRALWRADEDFEFTVASPSTAEFGYVQEGPSTLFDVELGFRQTRVDFESPLDEFVTDPDLLPDDLSEIEDDALERRYDAEVGLELATDAPSSYAFRLSGTRFDYTEENVDRTPRSYLEGSAEWRLRLTPVLSSALRGSYLYFEAENTAETEIREAEIDAGVIYEPSEVLSLGLGVGWGDREQEETVDGARETTESDSGPLIRGDITYLLPRFSLTGDARVTTAAPDTRFSGSLEATYDLPRAQLTGRLFQRYTGGRTGDEERVTGAAIGVEREITTVSQVGLEFAVARQVNVDDDDEPDVDRYDVTATYSHALTEVVAAEIGYRFRQREEDPENATSHQVFVTIGRTFQTGL
jgi:hypothetical protein